MFPLNTLPLPGFTGSSIILTKKTKNRRDDHPSKQSRRFNFGETTKKSL